jgi:hypothetical protein
VRRARARCAPARMPSCPGAHPPPIALEPPRQELVSPVPMRAVPRDRPHIHDHHGLFWHVEPKHLAQARAFACEAAAVAPAGVGAASPP